MISRRVAFIAEHYAADGSARVTIGVRAIGPGLESEAPLAVDGAALQAIAEAAGRSTWDQRDAAAYASAAIGEPVGLVVRQDDGRTELQYDVARVPARRPAPAGVLERLRAAVDVALGR